MILARFKEIIDKREALEILQKEFKLTLYLLMQYIIGTEEYNEFIKASNQNTKIEIDRSKKVNEMISGIERLYKAGKGYAEISIEMDVCERTVKKYISILKKGKCINKNVV